MEDLMIKKEFNKLDKVEYVGYGFLSFDKNNQKVEGEFVIKRLFYLIIISLIITNCSCEKKGDDSCYGLVDEDGDGYYIKKQLPHIKTFEKMMKCNGDRYVNLYYQLNTYDVLRVSDCKSERITEERLTQDVDCWKLRDIQEITEEY